MQDSEPSTPPKNGKLPSLDDLLARAQPYRRYANAPDGTRLRSLTELEVADHEEVAANPETRALRGAYLLMLSIVDEEGRTKYGENDLDALARLPSFRTVPIIKCINDLNAADYEEKKSASKPTLAE